jgi:hypothetical protein
MWVLPLRSDTPVEGDMKKITSSLPFLQQPQQRMPSHSNYSSFSNTAAQKSNAIEEVSTELKGCADGDCGRETAATVTPECRDYHTTCQHLNESRQVCSECNNVHLLNLLDHDVFSNIFSYLDIESLAALSETASRPNMECFYFLLLQLQRALVGSKVASKSSLLNAEDAPSKDKFLKVAGMGAVRRLAALSQPLAEEMVQQFIDSNTTVRGAPRVKHIRELLENCSIFVVKLRKLLFQAFGRADPSLIEPGCSERALCAAHAQATEIGATIHPITANESVSALGNIGEIEYSPQTHTLYRHLDQMTNTRSAKKIPRGSVGAYRRGVARARACVSGILKQRRRETFLSFPEEEQRQLASAFIDACRSDNFLPIVRDMLQIREIVDVEGFYIGSDNIESCALHTSAFHGSHKILEFLCRGLDDSDDAQDGGLCDVNLKDEKNGWTALHFAAAAYSVDAVRILANHGADLSIKANTGDTPLQWAARLQSEEVAGELRARDPAAASQGQSEPMHFGLLFVPEIDYYDCEALLCAHSLALKKLVIEGSHMLARQWPGFALFL